MQTLTRAEIGRRLAAGLGCAVTEAPVVIALSPGGVRVASEIARAFDAPLDVIGVCRLEVPGRPHSVFGAVADGADVVDQAGVQSLGLPPDYVASLLDMTRRDVRHREAVWRGGSEPVPVAGRTVVLVDDGSTEAPLAAAAALALKRAGVARLVFAAPTVREDLVRALGDSCDAHCELFGPEERRMSLVCDPEFTQTTRFEVRTMVRRSRENPAIPSV